MKVRTLVATLVALVVSALVLTGGQAQADIAPVLAVDNVFTALSAGEVDTAVALFAEDAVAENRLNHEIYVGPDEIRQMLQAMTHEERRFEIVRVAMIGDTVTVDVDISHRGIVWGTETFEATVNAAKLHTFDVTAFRMDLWRAIEPALPELAA